MSLKIKDNVKQKTPPVEPGVYMAVCIGVVDLGEQCIEWQGKSKYSNRCMYIWELVGEEIEVEGEMKPRQLSKEFAFSTDVKSSLRKFLESWNGKTYTDEEIGEFDLSDQVGKPCQINVTLNSAGTYANVDNIMPIPRGFPVPKTETPLLIWDMERWSDEVFAAIPEWIQDKIKKSTQYQKEHAPETVVEVKAQAAEECPI